MADDSITIVIIVLLGGDALLACLAAVEPLGHKIIVIHPNGQIEGSAETAHCPQNVPSRRRAGAEAATTPIVAFLEDTAVPREGWDRDIARYLAEGTGIAAVGGPVIIGSRLNAKSAALAITEFGRYQPEVWAAEISAKEADILPGVNCAFRRDALLAATSETKRLIDGETYDRLKLVGWRMLALSSMSVEYRHDHNVGAALSTRYFHGCIYGAQNLASASTVERVTSAAKALLLPFILSARAISKVPKGLKAPLSTCVWIVAQQSAWSAGELMGSFRGETTLRLSRWN
jgi:hypothetical protein